MKNTFAEHEQVLLKLEKEILNDGISIQNQKIDEKNYIIFDNSKDIRNIISNDIIKEIPLLNEIETKYNSIFSTIEDKLKNIDISLEKLEVVEIPKENKYENKEIQTDAVQEIKLDDSQVNLQSNISRSRSQIDIISNYSSVSENFCKEKSDMFLKELSEINITEQIKDKFCPRYIVKEDNKKGSIDLTNHLNEVAKNIAKEFNIPKKKNKVVVKCKYIANI